MQFYVHEFDCLTVWESKFQYAAENANTQYYGVYPKQVTF